MKRAPPFQRSLWLPAQERASCRRSREKAATRQIRLGARGNSKCFYDCSKLRHYSPVRMFLGLERKLFPEHRLGTERCRRKVVGCDLATAIKKAAYSAAFN